MYKFSKKLIYFVSYLGKNFVKKISFSYNKLKEHFNYSMKAEYYEYTLLMMYEATMTNILQPVIATIKGDLFTARKIPWLSETHFLPLNSTVTEYVLKSYGEVDIAAARSLLSYGRTVTWSAQEPLANIFSRRQSRYVPS